jgi:DNA-binding MarR family transcriptional regulator
MSKARREQSYESILEDLPFHLARAALVFRKFNDETLHTIGLHTQAPGMASVLHTVHEHDDCTVSDLVSKTHLANGTLTGLLDRLERDRFIKRVQNADDGRSWRIQLTPKGRTLCADLRRRHRMVMEIFGEVLSEKETSDLKRMLERVTERMRAYHAETKSARQRSSKTGRKSSNTTKPGRSAGA